MNREVQSSPYRTALARILVVGWIGLIVLIVSSVLRAFWFSPEFARAEATTHWPTAPGEIILSDPGRVSPTAGTLSGADFEFLQYRYTVHGRTYTNHRLQYVYTYDANETAAKFAARWAAKYPLGTNVAVHYSPDAPTNSVLEPGGDRSGAFAAGLALAGFFGAVGLVGLYFIHAATLALMTRRKS